MSEALGVALGAFGFDPLKKYRDGVIHARVYDYHRSMALIVELRDRPSEVLMTTETQSGLVSRLECVVEEPQSLNWPVGDEL